MKTASEHPLMSGLLWWGANLGQESYREECLEHDKLARYGWLAHDGRSYGLHEAIDPLVNANITIRWVRVDKEKDGDADGGGGGNEAAETASTFAGAGDHWAAQIRVEKLSDSPYPPSYRHAQYLTVAYWVSNDESGGGSSALVLEHEAKWRRKGGLPLDADQAATVRGRHSETGPFSMTIRVSETAAGGGGSSSGGDGATPPLAEEAAEASWVERLKRLSAYQHWGLGSFWGVEKRVDETWKVRDNLIERAAVQRRKLTSAVMQELEKSLRKEMGAEAFAALSDQERQMAMFDEKKWPPLVTPLPNSIDPKSNVVLVQHTLQMPFTLEVAFLSHQSICDIDLSSASSRCSSSQISKALESEQLRGAALERLFAEREAATAERIRSVYPKFDHQPVAVQQATKAALSNLIGSVGYWHGSSLELTDESQQALVDYELAEKQWQEAVKSTAIGMSEKQLRELFARRPVQPVAQFEPGHAHSLLSAVPSRSFFPRGFLWDEGFHQLIVHDFDPALSRACWKSWFSAQRESDGWIAREQILGSEAESRVPQEFIGQYPTHANPPTFCFLFAEMTRDEGNEKNQHFFQSLWSKLYSHYKWFQTLQQGKKVAWTVRWQGRKLNHTLASGLDDYPRGGALPHEDEMHLDGLCWMIFYSQTMSRIAQYIGRDAAEFEAAEREYMSSLHSLHWSEALGRFADVYSLDEASLLELGCSGEQACEVMLSPTRAIVKQHSAHIGYVSLFPLLFGLVDASEHPARFASLLDLIEHSLWSDHGLLSLSAQDPWFGTDENYWRGAIWANFQYLVCAGLRRHYLSGPRVPPDAALAARVQRLYDGLRSNFMQTLSSNYERTGYFWEQYDPQSGEGKRSHPFTGWTAVAMVRLMAEKY